MTSEEALLREVLSHDEPYFMDDPNGPGDWWCPFGCVAVPAIWGGHPVHPIAPEPFPHEAYCPFTRIRKLLEGGTA